MSTTAAPPGLGRRVLPTLNEDGTRRWIRPKPSHGKWWRRRQVVAYFLMAIFFAAPHLRLFGKPVFLMDLPRREFTLMGYTFLPTDTLLFMFSLGSLVIGIFLVTALWGRAWCGWACPQTVYLEYLFRPIGRWFDGGYTQSRALDKQGAWFTPRRLGKYITRQNESSSDIGRLDLGLQGLTSSVSSYFMEWDEIGAVVKCNNDDGTSSKVVSLNLVMPYTAEEECWITEQVFKLLL